MVVTCEIEFERNIYGTFFAGQMVSGTVILKANKPKEVKAVVFKILGFAETQWIERKITFREICGGREDYVASLTYLLGSEEGQKCTIQSGVHTYTFSCQLPHNCPSSFEGTVGRIRYVAKVILIRPWKFDQTYTRGLTVLKTFDLNYESPQLRMPCNSENYKTFCCGPCRTEPLKLVLSVPQTGYVPGQNIPVTALVINNTSLPVSKVVFSLVMLVRYFSQFPSKRVRIESITLTKAKGESVLRNCTRSLTAQLPIPATPPTCLHACSIIQIVYHVEVKAKVKTMHENQSITLPVTIGNVPLWNAVVSQQPGGSTGRANAAQVESGNKNNGVSELNGELPMVAALNHSPAMTSEMAHNIYPNLPPPSYEESLHTLRCDINAGEAHTFGPCEFAPLYPVYTLPANINAPTDSGIESGYVNESFQI